MTCHRYREAILDLARDAVVPAGVAEATRAHLDSCSACAGELARQRELTALFGQLVAEVEDAQPTAALEGRVMQLFVSSHQDQPARAGRGRPVVPRWAGVAAGLVAIVGLWTAAARRPSPAGSDRRDVGRPPVTAPTSAHASDTQAPEVSRPAPQLVRGKAVVQRGRSGRRPAKPSPVGPMEFMVIPAAAGLPALESARIVRTEVPIWALPEYGVTVVSDGARAAVEADLLIGQDGHARAIRVVTDQPHVVGRSKR